MRRRAIHLFPLAYGARRSPLIYPANRIRSHGRPRRIRCYKMCSIDSGLWCWDATTQAASDDAPSQRRGWSGVLSFFFEVRVREGRVTLPCKSLRGVHAPNRIPPASGAGTIRQSYPVVRPRPPIPATAVTTTLPHSRIVRLDLAQLAPPDLPPQSQLVKAPWIWQSMVAQHRLLPRPVQVPLRWTS